MGAAIPVSRGDVGRSAGGDLLHPFQTFPVPLLRRGGHALRAILSRETNIAAAVCCHDWFGLGPLLGLTPMGGRPNGGPLHRELVRELLARADVCLAPPSPVVVYVVTEFVQQQ